MIKRMTWTIPQPAAPEYRNDIMEGTEGVIEGWADFEQRQVILTVIVDLPSGAKQSITKETYTRNLKLTKEYQYIRGAHADLGVEQTLGQEHPPLPKQTLSNALNGPFGNQTHP